MKVSPLLLACTAFATLSAGQALAACADQIAELSPGTTTGLAAGTQSGSQEARVSKDGSRAPLQSAESSRNSPAATGSIGGAGTSTGQGASSGAHGIVKDGSTMPLANASGGQDATRATSGQDAQAQQRGGQTSTQTAESRSGQASTSGTHSPQMLAALERARTLHQQGNEAGCMQAIEEAKRLR